MTSCASHRDQFCDEQLWHGKKEFHAHLNVSFAFFLAEVFHQVLFKDSVILNTFKKVTDQCVFLSNDAFLPQKLHQSKYKIGKPKRQDQFLI